HFWRYTMKTASSRAFVAIMLAAVLNAGWLPGNLNIVSAQTNFGRISGAVKDASGAVIHGARVTVSNQATGVNRTVTTDDGGFYVVTNLPVGDYSVAVEQD